MPTQPSQSVVALPLAPSVRRALLCAGLSSVMDLQGLTETELMQGEYDWLLFLSLDGKHKAQLCQNHTL